MFKNDREGRVDQGIKLIIGERASIGLMCSFSKLAEERQDAGLSNAEILPGYCCLDKPFNEAETFGMKVRCIVTSELASTLSSRSSSNRFDSFTFDLKFTSLIARRTESTLVVLWAPSLPGIAKSPAMFTLERFVDSHDLAWY
jgi:hypothetical protein